MTVLVAAGIFLAACDPARAVRTIVRGLPGQAVSEPCVKSTIQAGKGWELKTGSEGGLLVFYNYGERRGGFNLTLGGDKSHPFVALEAVLITGKTDEAETLRNMEREQRRIAEAISRRCVAHGVLSCWDSKSNVEKPQCF